ncbi:MAG: efflux RND transporter permease subunit [Deltaproteobacteria bacterium]|nr:efflux RND transporter permease subunit [Deltaproteobacteria bacterium]
MKGRFSLARLSVHNPVLANLAMLTVIVLGVISLMGLPRELMPAMDMQWAFISKVYPGVPPEEIEKLITIPIEDEIKDVEGIDFIASQSNENAAFLSVKFKSMPDEEFQRRFQDLRAEVDKVTGLPEDAEDTIVDSFSTTDMVPVISVHLYGTTGEQKLGDLAKDLRQQLLDIPHISKVQLTGYREREIWVEANPAQLEGQHLSLDQIRTAIALHGQNVPAGKLDVGRSELFVRTIGEFDKAADIGKVILRTSGVGQSLLVNDVATITPGLEDEQTRSRLAGKPVISLTITKQSTGSSIAVTDEVKRISRAFAARSGDRVHVAFTQDSSEQINDILSKLTNNAAVGFLVVLFVLLVVLGMRNALLAAIGIPLSFFASFIFMFQIDESFNSSSLFALVLVLGIIVDDAIIIVENCYRHRQMKKSWKQAAIDGTEEVMSPVFSATATTIAAFLPLMLMPGIMGKFLRIVPIVVSLALLASLLEAFFILPSHFADWPGRHLSRPRPTPRWLQHLQNAYTRGLTRVVRFRYLAFFILMFVMVPGAVAMIGLLGVNVFQGEEVATFQVRITMPEGASLSETSRVLKEFEKIALALPRNEVREVHATAGLIIKDDDWDFRSSVAQVWLDLVPSYERARSTDAIMESLRQQVTKIPGPIQLELAKLNTGPPMGKPVEVKVKGRYFEELALVADQLKHVLGSLNGVRDVGDDRQVGKEEIRIHVDEDQAVRHGLSVAQVGMAIRSAIDGTVAETMYDGDEEIDIIVRADMSAVKQPEDLQRLPLLSPMGYTVALGDVASWQMKRSSGLIRRYKGQRAITVFSGFDETKIDTRTINNRLLAEFEKIQRAHPGVTLDFSGEMQEFKDMWANIISLFAFGMLLIYAILGTQFRSYVQPLVIFFTIPFAFVGAVLGLLISGNPFSLITMYGIVALAGVAVNDAIVLVSFVNNERRHGMPIKKAVIEAGRLRIRPILLTTLTTIAGLTPMALGIGGASLTWSPLANTILWGLGVGTLLTLFLIPAIYVIFIDDIGGLIRRWQAASIRRSRRRKQKAQRAKKEDK